MSRSLHPTLKRHGVRTDAPRKRALKSAVREGRRVVAFTPAASAIIDGERDAARLSIVARNIPSDVHFPASIDDMRAVLARLPAGVLEGLAGVELRAPGGELDMISRGLLGGRAMGFYRGSDATIFVFGYVYDADRPDRRVIETFLRAELLATLMHEVAHHVDISPPTVRGRWDRFCDREPWAEAGEHAWTREIVIPYLEDVHAADVAHLRAWIREHGGIDLDLAALIGDPREHGTSRSSFGMYSTRSIFFDLVRDVREGKRGIESRRNLASWLDFRGDLDDAERVLAGALEEAPGDRHARRMVAVIRVQQMRLDEAEVIARELVAEEPTSPDGWNVLADAAQRRGDWPKARDLRAHLRALLGDSLIASREQRSNDLRLAEAFVETGQWDDAERELASVDARAVYPHHHRDVLAMRALLALRRDDPEEALAAVRSWEALGGPLDRRPLVAVVRFAAARRLGRPREGRHLTTEDVRWLFTSGHAAWARELGLGS